MDNRFSKIGESFDRYKERRQSELQMSYERKIVKRILLGLGLDRVSLGVERPEAKDDDGSYLTLGWMYDHYPTFPLILQTRETWAPDIRDFFKVRSRKNSFWAVWEEVSECLGNNGKPIGCVFPFPQATDLGHGILHNASLKTSVYTDENFKDYVRMMRDEMGKPPVTLELLDSFTNRLRLEWEPT